MVENIMQAYTLIEESYGEQDDGKLLVIMRGLPGSGKSTKAKRIQSQLGGEIFSTDDYPGLYEKNPETGELIFHGGDKTDSGLPLIVVAHQWNQQRAIDAMDSGMSPVIVDNTNVQKWEARPYVKAGVDRGYNVAVEEADTEWKFDVQELSGRNTHGVSLAGIQGMLDRWETDWDTDSVLKSKAPWE